MMSDFFSHLLELNQGTFKGLQPLIEPLFAPSSQLANPYLTFPPVISEIEDHANFGPETWLPPDDLVPAHLRQSVLSPALLHSLESVILQPTTLDEIRVEDTQEIQEEALPLTISSLSTTDISDIPTSHFQPIQAISTISAPNPHSHIISYDIPSTETSTPIEGLESNRAQTIDKASSDHLHSQPGLPPSRETFQQGQERQTGKEASIQEPVIPVTTDISASEQVSEKKDSLPSHVNISMSIPVQTYIEFQALQPSQPNIDIALPPDSSSPLISPSAIPDTSPNILPIRTVDHSSTNASSPSIAPANNPLTTSSTLNIPLPVTHTPTVLPFSPTYEEKMVDESAKALSRSIQTPSPLIPSLSGRGILRESAKDALRTSPWSEEKTVLGNILPAPTPEETSLASFSQNPHLTGKPERPEKESHQQKPDTTNFTGQQQSVAQIASNESPARIHIRIGRVEVRALPPSPPSNNARSASTGKPHLTLNEYMKQRRREELQ